MTASRGSVVLVVFPNSDLVTYRRRPALVVQADDVRTELAQTVLVLITTTQRSGATRVPVPKDSSAGRSMGLLHDSVIVADNMATVRNRQIARVLGRCPDMDAVDAALRQTLAL